MISLNNRFMKLVIQVDDRSYEVKAICTSAGEANVVCNLNPNLAVIAEDTKTGLVFVAEMTPQRFNTTTRDETMLPVGCLTNDGKLVTKA